MILQRGADYETGEYSKALFVAESKVGKSCYLVGGALGLLPWQKSGAVVDRPEHLHVVSVDANALGGVKRFLKVLCRAPDEALKFRVYNVQNDFRKIHESNTGWDYSFYDLGYQIFQQIKEYQEKVGGVHLVLFSSLTGFGFGLLRGLQGPPSGSRSGSKKGTGMDESKWGAFAAQVSEIRNLFQVDSWHVWWEAHLYRPPDTIGRRADDGDSGKPKQPETIQIPGKSGWTFAFNTEQVFRIIRDFDNTWAQTNIDKMWLDTRPSLDFISGGRGFTECLKSRELDPAATMKKLSLKVGGWRPGRKRK